MEKIEVELSEGGEKPEGLEECWSYLESKNLSPEDKKELASRLMAEEEEEELPAEELLVNDIPE